MLQLSTLLLALLPVSETTLPGATWMRYADPAQAGWSSAGLARAQEAWQASASAAFLVVERGVVVAAWGEVDRRFMCHSVRKSLLSGLYGVHDALGTLDLEATLAELGIDDEPALTDEEKSARVVDLLAARSGIYKLAAYEPPQNPKPERGSHAPGTHWCYNNFDFNTLLTIFEAKTGTRIFDEFDQRFARPLGMQDYRPRDGYYHYERDKSIHPAYPFRMSARDLARYGLLFLNEGAWGEQRLLPADWVARSTDSHSNTGRPDQGYGFMWWTQDAPSFAEGRMISALGVGGQSIDILPGEGVVCVNRTDTYLGRDLPSGEREGIIGLVLAARGKATHDSPTLVPLEPAPGPDLPALDRELAAGFVGDWPSDRGRVRVELDRAGLHATSPGVGSFDLIPLTDDIVYVEDMRAHARLVRDASGAPQEIVIEAFALRSIRRLLGAGNTDQAGQLCEEMLEHFPDSAASHAALASVFARTGEKELARGLIETALELDPSNAQALEGAARLR